MNVEVTDWVDNRAMDGFESEHGLSLLIQSEGTVLAFDTGAGKALLPNMRQLRIDPQGIDGVVFSHGHYDHTGGFPGLIGERDGKSLPVFMTPGMENPCYSRHENGKIHTISMPKLTLDALKNCGIRYQPPFSEIFPGFFLTGPIPRLSGEGTGGDFYGDRACTVPHQIGDEQALLLSNGLLISGCCHAGIINTVEYCRKMAPDIPVRSIMGGLHLCHASGQRLGQTLGYLSELNLENLILLHCTGEEAGDFLIRNLPGITRWGHAGETFTFS